MPKCLRDCQCSIFGCAASKPDSLPPLPAPAAPEREMSTSFVGNLDNVPGNKNVRTAVVERTFEQFNWIFDSSDIDIGIGVGQNLTKFE